VVAERLYQDQGLPIVGYLPFLGSLPHLGLQKLAKRYGGIFSVRLGSRNVVVISDFQASKEAFAKDALMGRPPELPFHLSQTNIDLEVFLGARWKEQRRFALHMLRDLGLGKSRMEVHIQEEITELLEQFERNANKPFFLRPILAPSMSNNIGALMFGKRYKYDDPIRTMLSDAVSATSTLGQQIGWLVFFPWIKRVFSIFGIGNIDKLDKAIKELNIFTRKEIEEHERTLNPDEPRDFIDGYLLEMKKKKDNPTFCKDVLEDVVVGFFGAGSETVRLSLEWLTLIVATLPDAQRRIQAEIDSVIGRNRMPEWPDQKNMPYTEAFITEVNRWRTITPLNILKYTLTDTEVSGYVIPKHTVVVSNLWAIHHDPKTWGSDAEEFRPERFLSDDGKSIKKQEQYIPFSIGKRACPGEPLAKVEVFLYFASILQKFDLRFPEGKKPDYGGTLTVGLQPHAQEIILMKRY